MGMTKKEGKIGNRIRRLQRKLHELNARHERAVANNDEPVINMLNDERNRWNEVLQLRKRAML